jgi:dTMP kinase
MLITFEGGEACGKSTQIKHLHKKLTQNGHQTIVTHDPGYTEIGLAIRHLLLHAREGDRMLPETELLLFAASRAQLVGEIIRPEIEKGKIVLCDRFNDSTIVYQGIARGLDLNVIETLYRFVAGSIRPTLTFLLDLDLETARYRRLRRVRPVGTNDRIEEMPSLFFEKVREGYLMLAKREPARIKIIDASQSEEKVEEAIWNELHAILS